MRVLLVSQMVPLPADNGFKLRSLALLRTLADRGHQVTLVAFCEAPTPTAAWGALSEMCREVHLVPRKNRQLHHSGDYLKRIWALLRARPYATERFRSGPMRRRIREVLRDQAIDLILCDSIFSGVNLPRVGPPVALNAPNVEHLVIARYLPLAASWPRRVYAYLESRYLRRIEADACRRARLVLSCSKEDRSLLSSLTRHRAVFVVPNAVSVSDYRTQEVEDGTTVLYTGAMDWYPNQDAVQFFTRDILPTVRNEVPAVKFVVAGRNPPPAFVAGQSRIPGVTFAGAVPDMREHLGRAALCVVPLRMGSGTRLKILEAAAAGKAVVSTGLGAEGLDFVPGEEILLANDPAEFAQWVVRLLRDQDLRRKLGRAARRRAEVGYDLRVLGEALVGALHQAGLPA